MDAGQYLWKLLGPLSPDHEPLHELYKAQGDLSLDNLSATHNWIYIMANNTEKGSDVGEKRNGCYPTLRLYNDDTEQYGYNAYSFKPHWWIHDLSFLSSL